MMGSWKIMPSAAAGPSTVLTKIAAAARESTVEYTVKKFYWSGFLKKTNKEKYANSIA